MTRTTTTDSACIQLEIGDRLDNVELVQVLLDAWLRPFEIDEECSYWLGLAVTEAVANAIEHGNVRCPKKRVQIEMGWEADQVVIRVADEGDGFDPRTIPDPLTEDNLLKPNGRGVWLMKKLMDEVHYRIEPGQGTVVTLRKKIEEAKLHEA